jgi:hypothetical protein
MATNTYIALDKITVSSSVPSVTFTSIPQGYTDLVVICSFISSAAQSVEARVGNGSIDTGNNYSNTALIGTSGNTAISTRRSNFSYFTFFEQNGASSGTWIMNFQNYSNTTTFKTMIGRNGNASTDVEGSVQLWRSTAAINTLQLFAGQGGINFTSGATFSLYGIAAEGISPAPKATGGAIYDDALYYYHVFGSTGVFTPTSSLTADVLVVAGGGGAGGGTRNGGGGGAGGLLAFTSQSLTATNYTCTVGAGGTGATDNRGTTGGNSQFAALTASLGGGGGAGYSSGPLAPLTGGSGGGAGGGMASQAGAAGTSGQGNDGGASNSSFSFGFFSGGGGGAGAAGTAGTNLLPGPGGNGSSTYSSWVLATGVGELINGVGYIAGGGGGGYQADGSVAGAVGGFGGGGRGNTLTGFSGVSGVSNTGGGGGGGGWAGASGPGVGGNGGSGVVIVRYLKA